MKKNARFVKFAYAKRKREEVSAVGQEHSNFPPKGLGGRGR